MDAFLNARGSVQEGVVRVATKAGCAFLSVLGATGHTLFIAGFA